MRVSGRVIAGTGAWKPRIERFPEVFTAHFGFPLFPGTLNVLIEVPLPVRAESRIPGSEIGEPEQDMLFERCLVNGFEAFRLRPFQPATGAGGHGDHILEIVSAHELRPLLGEPGSVIVEFPGRDPPVLRPLRRGDAKPLADAFAAIGWRKPAETFLRYAAEEEAGARSCWVAEEAGALAGYVTVRWPPPGRTGLAEIQDLNVLPSFRRRGIGTALLDQAEAAVALRADAVQIAVGLHQGYGAAQRLYVQRGYVPDGQGATVEGQSVPEGAAVVLDDAHVLILHKALKVP
jgi:ribosomal protein S18 acetylase RimI-like enzyme